MLIEDYGLKSNLIKIDYKNKKIYDSDRTWEIPLTFEKLPSIVINGGFNLKDLSNENYYVYYFTAEDDNSAKLIYMKEIGEL